MKCLQCTNLVKLIINLWKQVCFLYSTKVLGDGALRYTRDLQDFALLSLPQVSYISLLNSSPLSLSS